MTHPYRYHHRRHMFLLPPYPDPRQHPDDHPSPARTRPRTQVRTKTDTCPTRTRPDPEPKEQPTSPQGSGLGHETPLRRLVVPVGSDPGLEVVPRRPVTLTHTVEITN
ncbi:Hypothetical predicted protein [Marmota monax]|uniref:Uncharacterized protein n=1 Tax=Marmota monax TaxID=9995 RepID=A0A5E4BS54_MARMO|nr:Hypothetical predicted protein [Marmota monax]